MQKIVVLANFSKKNNIIKVIVIFFLQDKYYKTFDIVVFLNK